MPKLLPGQWLKKAANDWYARQPLLVGANYVPATASNQLEMWQADTFDPARIDLELGWAKDLGMNTMRVFLHDLVWKDDPEGFTKRIDAFLAICEKHEIKPMLVLFDSVWNPFPKSGKQEEPRPGVHNSRWVQSPGADALIDPAQYPRLKDYVTGIVQAFANDKRILAWDVWNEPDNVNAVYGAGGEMITGSYGHLEPRDKASYIETLLPQVFAWVREAKPIHPLTCGVWIGDWNRHENMKPWERIQLEQSDIISFHNYGSPQEFRQRIECMKRYNRPVFCTEWMARPSGNTFEAILPLARKFNVAMMNWGFVEGRSQTNLPWDSWDNAYTGERQPAQWFHDVLHRDGRPYRQEEADALKAAKRPPYRP